MESKRLEGVHISSASMLGPANISIFIFNAVFPVSSALLCVFFCSACFVDVALVVVVVSYPSLFASVYQHSIRDMLPLSESCHISLAVLDVIFVQAIRPSKSPKPHAHL